MILDDSKIQKPTKPCGNCGGNKWWQRVFDGHWLCSRCHPDPEIIKPKDSINQRRQII